MTNVTLQNAVLSCVRNWHETEKPLLSIKNKSHQFTDDQVQIIQSRHQFAKRDLREVAEKLAKVQS